MTREVQSAILILLGVVTLRITIEGSYTNYVKESMRPWLLASGAVLVVLGILAAIEALSPRGDPSDREDLSKEDHDGHAHRGPRTAWLLLAPILTIFLIAPPALGAYAASRDSTNIAPTTTLGPLPDGDPVPVYLSDYVTRAVWDHGTSLKGRTVELTGFVLSQTDGPWLLARLQITCCAADAFASKVQPVNLPSGTPTLPENTWVSIIGEWVPGGGTDPATEIPLIKVHSIRQVQQPDNPYD